jgi:hypothetical protein
MAMATWVLTWRSWFGFVEEVVEVGTEEGGDTVEERHGVSFQC